eukprot:TRINITY_DN27179_c0_g1_i3.p1 TRINITY_DN27179_c0_g1~~TRINITY_DN27179_c0_g1_i3.p1  ORF type:complete len:279 (-),score=53.65 TRINITY_DN27179_c0_g1_i3:294-1130(-)
MSSSFPSYSDFGKSTKDVLSGGRSGLFQFDQKITLSGKSPDGVSFNINSVNKGNQVTAEAKGSYKYKTASVDVTATSAGQLKTAVSYSDLAPGLKVSLSGALPDLSSGKLGIDYCMQYLSAKGSLGLSSTPKIELAASTGYQGFVVGGEVAYDSAKQMLSKWSTALGYVASEWAGTIMLTDKGDAIKAQFAHNMSPTSVAAAEVQQTLSTSTTTFTVGYQTKLPSGALAKVKLNNMGVMAMLYEHNIQPGTKVSACYQLDVTNLEQAPKYGIAVDLTS